MTDVYKTIESHSEGLYKEKGSRFISFAYPVQNEEEIRKIVMELKEKYYDARHHCYAWKLGVTHSSFRAYDDGEPTSTAGKPILGQILSYELTNILIVVIRYFGGTKLGVSGLINAYREAAIDALKEAVIMEKTVDELLQIRFSYLVMNDVMKIIKEEELKVIDRHFELECEMTLSIRKSELFRLRSHFGQIESMIFSDETKKIY